MKMKFTEGMPVAVCYDGKWGRAVEGRITSVGPGAKRGEPEWVKVRFLPWKNEEAGFVELLFEPNDRGWYGAWLTGPGERGILRMLGCQGDWYGLVAIKVLDEYGIEVLPFHRQTWPQTHELKTREDT